MKNLTFFIALLFCLTLTAQDFPGSNPRLLLGKKVKVKDNSDYKNQGYADFYLDKEFNKKYACCQKANSKYEELANKTFKVEDVTPNSDNTYCLKLKSGSQTVYYKYDAAYESRYPFTVEGGLKIEESAYIDFIHERDNPDGQRGTSFISDPKDGISFYKSAYDGQDSYLLTISTVQAKPDESAKGVILHLENNITIKRLAAEVKITPDDNGGYIYSNIFTLKSEEVALLKINKILRAQIGAFRIEINEGTALKGIFRSLGGLTPKKSELNMKACDLITKTDLADSHSYLAVTTGGNLLIYKNVDKYDKSVKYEAVIKIQKNEAGKTLGTATLLLEKGEPILRDAVTVEVKPTDKGMYEYSTHFYLTEAEIYKLKNYTVYKAMIDEHYAVIEYAALFRDMFNCLVVK